jgi:hypothetical protein
LEFKTSSLEGGLRWMISFPKIEKDKSRTITSPSPPLGGRLKKRNLLKEIQIAF